MAMAYLAGDLIADRFEIVRPVRTGGMGEVYQARDRTTGGQVALKFLTDLGNDGAARFTREARLLTELHHPGVVAYVSHGRTPAAWYLAMEWLEGESLSDRLFRGGLSLAEAIALAERTAHTLADVHSRGVIHRDIKPSNLFLRGSVPADVVLLDFGIARSHEATRGLTRTGVMIGTPGYLAPEQARGASDVSTPADLFSLGCVLFECVTGRPPFDADHVLASLARVLFEDAPRVSELAPDLPDALDELVARMLCRDPAGRPGADEVAAALATIPVDGNSRPTRSAARADTLTGDERRLLSVILAADPGAAGPADDTAATVVTGDVDRDDSTLREIVRAHGGGALERLNDGTYVATVAGAGTASDQALLATRCALAMRRALPGSAVVLATGRAHSTQRLPVGALLDRAAGMLESSTEDQPPLRVDPTTAGLLDTRFAFQSEGSGDGLALVEERDPCQPIRTLLGKPTPCVGRERELASLEAILCECIDEPVARVAVVTAPAGYGKTRLRHELCQRVAEGGITPLLGAGDPLAAGSPYFVLGRALQRAAGIEDTDPPAEMQDKLRTRLSLRLSESDRERVILFLAELAGCPFPDHSHTALTTARQDPILMGDQIRRAWEDWIDAECAAGPVLLVLEDLHWGDLPSVNLIDTTLRRHAERPLLVLALARPEVHDLFPALWTERHPIQISLTRLTRRAASRLVHQVLGDATPQATVDRVVELAAGNAFYLEELIRGVAEGVKLPDSVLAMVQGRLEALDPTIRRALRAASILGQPFRRSTLAALLGRPPEAAVAEIDELTRLELLQPQSIAPPAGESGQPSGCAGSHFSIPREDDPAYAFRHALVQDAAYSMLTDEDRRLGHRLAAEHLRARRADPMVLAEHFDRAEAPHEAAHWYRLAADQALAANDFPAAIERAARALRGAPTGADLVYLRLRIAEAERWRGRPIEAQAAARRALDASPPHTPSWYQAVEEVITSSTLVGDTDTLFALVDRIVLDQPSPDEETHLAQVRIASTLVVELLIGTGRQDLARRFYDWLEQHSGWSEVDRPALHGAVHLARAMWHGSTGDEAASAAAFRAGAVAYEEAGDFRRACRCRLNFGYSSGQLGQFELAEAALRESMTQAERMGLTTLYNAGAHNLGHVLHCLDRLDEALAVESAAIEALRAQKDVRMVGSSRIYLAEILYALGQVEQAIAEGEAAVVDLVDVAPSRAQALGTLGHILVAAGRPERALAAATEAYNLIVEMGGTDEGESIIRLAYAEALDAAGDTEAARAAIAEARDRLLARAGQIADPEQRDSFLRRVCENARTLELAETLLAE